MEGRLHSHATQQHKYSPKGLPSPAPRFPHAGVSSHCHSSSLSDKAEQQDPTALQAASTAVFPVSAVWSMPRWGWETRPGNAHRGHGGLCLSRPEMLASRKTPFTSSLPPTVTLPELKFHWLGSSPSLILQETPTQTRSLEDARPSFGRAPGQQACLVVLKLPRNVKQMSPLKKKLFILWNLSQQAETWRKFITWGTKPMILESSCTEGIDVFYGK